MSLGLARRREGPFAGEIEMRVVPVDRDVGQQRRRHGAADDAEPQRPAPPARSVDPQAASAAANSTTSAATEATNHNAPGQSDSSPLIARPAGGWSRNSASSAETHEVADIGDEDRAGHHRPEVADQGQVDAPGHRTAAAAGRTTESANHSIRLAPSVSAAATTWFSVRLDISSPIATISAAWQAIAR